MTPSTILSSSTWALLCTLSPLAGFAIALTLLRRRPQLAAAVSLLTGTIALAGAWLLLARGSVSDPAARQPWLESEGVAIVFGFLLDGPNLLMGAIVATIAWLVQLYSLGYMAHDASRARYFALLSFFSWSMLSFVYAANLLQMFVFWELVGLASFLLIGFWYEKPAAAAAARKAFVMTRIGDVGMFVGLILLLSASGTLDIKQLNDASIISTLSGSELNGITLLLFCGVIGKSAQFPLHTWLPDAMEGPTPVSALLHSATMVAAGVFLFARFHPLFVAAAATSQLVFLVAMFTALLAATIAMVQRDIKRVLAYSSISQLGFMLVGLAAGSLYAGLFHLTTHALFKALLFLTAGAFISRCGTNDMVEIGRMRASGLRTAKLGLLIGSASLAGLWPFCGFFSKESILGVLKTIHFLLNGGAYLVSFLTAYYSGRMLFLVLRPNSQSAADPAATDRSTHPVTLSMRVPLLLLSGASVVAGFAGDWLADLTGTVAVHARLKEMLPAVAIVLAGIGLAWFDFGRRGAAQIGLIARVPPLERLFVNKWYIDAFYAAVVGRLVQGIAVLCAAIESRALDGSGDALARATLRGGRGAAATQSGRLQLYVGTATLMLAILVYLVAR